MQVSVLKRSVLLSIRVVFTLVLIRSSRGTHHALQESDPVSYSMAGEYPRLRGFSVLILVC